MKYNDIPLTLDSLLPDPLSQFDAWYKEAKAIEPFDASAMTLATTDKAYHVNARMLLLKGYSNEGFTFFTNYQSPKGKALDETHRAAMLFWWPQSQRQVRITGHVVKLKPEQSDAYFYSRPRESQIAAIVSPQSDVILSRETLMDDYNAISENEALVRPPHWGGYCLVHETLEFWQGRPHRLHDRFEYRKQKDKWVIVQLAP